MCTSTFFFQSIGSIVSRATYTYTLEIPASEIEYMIVVYITDPADARISSYIDGVWNQTTYRNCSLSGNTLTMKLFSGYDVDDNSFFIYG